MKLFEVNSIVIIIFLVFLQLRKETNAEPDDDEDDEWNNLKQYDYDDNDNDDNIDGSDEHKRYTNMHNQPVRLQSLPSLAQKRPVNNLLLETQIPRPLLFPPYIKNSQPSNQETSDKHGNIWI